MLNQHPDFHEFRVQDMDDSQIKRWIMHSVDEVICKLPKIRQEEYRNLLK